MKPFFERFIIGFFLLNVLGVVALTLYMFTLCSLPSSASSSSSLSSSKIFDPTQSNSMEPIRIALTLCANSGQCTELNEWGEIKGLAPNIYIQAAGKDPIQLPAPTIESDSRFVPQLTKIETSGSFIKVILTPKSPSSMTHPYQWSGHVTSSGRVDWTTIHSNPSKITS